MPLLLKVREETPAEEAHGKFGVRFGTVYLDLADELTVLGRVTGHDLLLHTACVLLLLLCRGLGIVAAEARLNHL